MINYDSWGMKVYFNATAGNRLALLTTMVAFVMLASVACDRDSNEEQATTGSVRVVSMQVTAGAAEIAQGISSLPTKTTSTGTAISLSTSTGRSSRAVMTVTPIPAVTPQPTATPTGTLTSGVASSVSGAVPPSGFVIPERPSSHCIPEGRDWSHRKLLKWTSDGTKILFDHGDEYLFSFSATEGQAVYVTDADGSQLQRVAEGSFILEVYDRPSAIGGMMYFDVSPNGSRVVYSTCRHGPLSANPPKEGSNIEYQHSYEIDAANIDGTDVRRLTFSNLMDNYPVCSPDGARIAFIRELNPLASYERSIFTMEPDGSNMRELTPEIADVAMRPPVWSPNGDSLAFVRQGLNDRWGTIYTVRADGTQLTRVSDTVRSPSWSPDGQRLAFAAIDGEGVSLFIASADGSDRTKVAPIMENEVELYVYHQTYYSATFMVSWSPRGDQIMYLCEPSRYTAGVCIVDTYGTSVGKTPEFEYTNHYVNIAEWSPDGSRIAVRTLGTESGGVFLYTMAPDGSAVEYLLELEEDSEGRRHLKVLNSASENSAKHLLQDAPGHENLDIITRDTRSVVPDESVDGRDSTGPCTRQDLSRTECAQRDVSQLRVITGPAADAAVHHSAPEATVETVLEEGLHMDTRQLVSVR